MNPFNQASNLTFSDWKTIDDELAGCRRCARLVAWRETVAREKKKAYRDQEYWGKPVPGFGDREGRVAVVGLAPGAHGSNRTGRMFTGDASGDFLYPALHRAGFASQPEAVSRGDGLTLYDLYIIAVCRCAPPDNKPERGEMEACRPFLEDELALMTRLQGIVCLGRIAFERVSLFYRALGASTADWNFEHAGFIQNGGGLPWVLNSYHPSRQNTQTGRLNVEMFNAVWTKARSLLG